MNSNSGCRSALSASAAAAHASSSLTRAARSTSGSAMPALSAVASLPILVEVRRRQRLVLQAEVGEGAVAVPVEDQPRDLAAADVEQGRYFRRPEAEVQPAGGAAAGVSSKDEHAL